MSEVSLNVTIFELFDVISTQCNRYGATLIILFGVIGNMLNILVLSQNSFRTNSCAWIFLAASIINLISILSGLTTRIVSGWTTDPASYLDAVCKLRAYFVFTTRTIALWLIVLATIDRWLLSSIDANRRRKSTLKSAQKCTIIIIVLSALLYVQQLFCYEANLPDQALKCNGKSIVCRYISNLSFALITILVPLLLMSIFGLLTIANIRQSHRRIQSTTIVRVVSSASKSSGTTAGHSNRSSTRKTDRSILRMLFVQVLILTILTLPLSIQNFYATFYAEDESAVIKAIDRFSYDITVLVYFVANGVPFYIYTLFGGSVFRKALSDSIMLIKRKLLFQ